MLHLDTGLFFCLFLPSAPMTRRSTPPCKPSGKLTIGRLAKAVGVNLTTIRYYQNRGLLQEPAKPWGGVRHYGEAELRRLWLIRHAKELGFTLAEIANVVRHVEQQDCDSLKAVADRKLRDITQQIRALEKGRKALKKLIAACRPASRGADCPATCPMMVKVDLTPTTDA